MTEEFSELDRLRARVLALETERAQRGWLRLWLALGLVVLVALGGTWVKIQNDHSIARERAARRASEQAFCGIIVLLDNAWIAAPPTTDSGRQLASAVSTARIVNGCPPPQGD
jgi:hypothetical protein